MTQGDLFSASAAIPPQISSQLPLTEGLPSIIDVIAQVSTRPRYAFMVLNLIARAAGQGGRAGPYVVQQGRAVRLAGTASDDVIVNILARRREPPRPLTIVTPEDLALRHPPRADCTRYDSLRGLHAAA